MLKVKLIIYDFRSINNLLQLTLVTIIGLYGTKPIFTR
jgi:hypothetical protein